ncbi:hypothetical protein [Nostoc sp. UHCC 0251]|uniref:hypothetical protein n=1 Tax=Nostoc sp. UHCC 0251 TaxID=3110240 RepID=UPI002B1EBE8C|nr:hypothetical protein [Nostoc sp. UHCC 0251]MEA5624662.1 hypothetical protein [Nostoc sp. UHCC 0251]
MENNFRDVVYSNPRKLLLTSVGLIVIAYISTCLFLYVRQPYLIFRPIPKILTLPSSPDIFLPYKDVRLAIAGSNEYIHGWWIPAPLTKELEVPKQIVTKASVKGKLKIRNYFQCWGMGA